MLVLAAVLLLAAAIIDFMAFIYLLHYDLEEERRGHVKSKGEHI